jgi:transposase
MRISKDKKQQRYQMIVYALEHGIKPAARLYATGTKTVRKWIKRFKQGGYATLEDVSRRPKHSPNALSPEECARIIALKAKYKRLGAEQIKSIEQVPASAKTMRKKWREAGVSNRQRRKKHVTKQNLREIKKQFALFERVCEDTKDLHDIPEYWPQMIRKKLPKVQYTYRYPRLYRRGSFKSQASLVLCLPWLAFLRISG